MYRRTFMIVFLTLLTMLSLAACSQGNEGENTGVPPAKPAVDAPEPVEAVEPTEPASKEAPVKEEGPVIVPTTTPEAEAPTQDAAPAEPGAGYANSEEGVASYLSDALHGATTASGEIYDKDTYVAAHKDLPFGTQVRVTSLYNNSTVVVTVIDRMPANNPHVIDVSYVAAVDLDMLESGNIEARVEWDE